MTDSPRLLSGLRIVEVSAFVAAPLGGALLAGLGAEVIRIDPIGGGIDFRRWPLAAGGMSLYWAGLNQGKRSVALDLGTQEGRDLALALAAAPGEDSGLVLTNHPPGSWFSYPELVRRRPDVIACRIEGRSDGSAGVDYTINAATGLPYLTGPAGLEGPVNSVLPAWDVITGHQAVIGLLAAERARRSTGAGHLIRISLEAVSKNVMAHLGFVAEAYLEHERPRLGNDLYGAFGRDFETADGRRVMVVAITAGQLRRLIGAIGAEHELDALEARRGSPIRSDGDLFEHRQELAEIVGQWVGGQDADAVESTFDEHAVLWGPYRQVSELATKSDSWSVMGGGGFELLEQPGVGTYPHPLPSIRAEPGAVSHAARAPLLGCDTVEVLEQVLGLSRSEVERLARKGVIADGS